MELKASLAGTRRGATGTGHQGRGSAQEQGMGAGRQALA